jgi:hypothetical protein
MKLCNSAIKLGHQNNGASHKQISKRANLLEAARTRFLGEYAMNNAMKTYKCMIALV